MTTKYWTSLVAGILMTLTAWSQNLKVTSFRELPYDLTANTYGTAKEDWDGRTCALIKVVAPEQNGFLFEAGTLGIVAFEPKEGEMWVYIPQRSEKLTIKHSKFGTLRDYFYPIPIDGGKTYEMLLDVGTGKFVTLSPSVANAKVYVDQKYVGEGVINKQYLNYGIHTIRAVSGMYEGEYQVNITPSYSDKVISVTLTDQSHHYGEVEATVADNAEIWYAGHKVANGTWKENLREGTYTITTKRVDCDDSETYITVKPLQKNEITLKSPTPHTGYLRVYTRPQSASIKDNRGHLMSLANQVELPIGTHSFQFSHRGFKPMEREWTVRHNELVVDTVQMERISYVKKSCFYFGLSYTAIGLQGGITPLVGAILGNNDFQFSYTFGTTTSNGIYLYDANNVYAGALEYRENTFSIKYGYQIALLGRFAFTPQVGFSVHSLACNTTDPDFSKEYADQAIANSATVGVRLAWVPMQHLYIFLAPQMGFVVQQDDAFKMVADKCDFNASGFGLQAGLIANF
jgi:hypothetical protein